MVDESTVIKTLKSFTLAEEKLDCRNGKELGRGAYGRVFTVKYCGQCFAAKEIHSVLLNETGKKERESIRKSFLCECYHCLNLRHPNIVQFIGVYWPEQRSSLLPVMVMELMDCTLKIFIENHPKTDTKLKHSILHDVTVGLSYLHAQSPPVIHRDLTPNNILLTNKFVAKIGDLGVAKAIQTGGGRWFKKNLKLTKVPGTPDFMPPEACCENPTYNTSLDVFSFGGIVLFVMTEEWPSPSVATIVDPRRTRGVKGFTETERRKKYLTKMTHGLRELVENCLDNDPSKRLQISAAMEKIESLQVRLCFVS